MHVVMDSACGGSLQNMRMRSEHLDISNEDTVMVEDTARLSYRGCNV